MRRAIKRAFSRAIKKHAFSSAWTGVFFNPFWLCRRAIRQAIEQDAATLHGAVLDFGCGTSPYRQLLTQAATYLGLEYDTPENRQHKRADIFYDGRHIPLDDASIDGLISTQTIEHVPNPQEIVGEWARVLRSGGQVIMTVPFMWPEHEMSYDYQRYTSNGIKKLLEDSGFSISRHAHLLCDCRAPAQIFIAWLYDALALQKRSSITQVALSGLLFTPVALVASALARVIPDNTNTFADNYIVATRK